MGMATARELERVAASLGLLTEATLQFEPTSDLPNGGVLCALPALMVHGLLDQSIKAFPWPKGFYPLETIFLTIAFLAMARVPSLEQVRYQSPGEWGKLLGLDRIPEVKTLREKIAALSQNTTTLEAWRGALVKQWMEATEESQKGIFLVDGHTRLYHGDQTTLPRRFISRQRLCLRATTDYWVNALDGQPFFYVTKAIDPGMQRVLEEEIIPKLKVSYPGQPSEEKLKQNLMLHCFILITDREGYSPAFMARQWKDRVAVISYHKFPEGDWPKEEFEDRQVTSPYGEVSILKLAERGTYLKSGKIWVKEVRSLTPSGHQTAIIATAYSLDLMTIAANMFGRWNQENFFRYMIQHYGLDKLIEYGVRPLPEDTKLVNPQWRKLDGQVRSAQGKLIRQRAEYSKENLEQAGVTDPEAAAKYEVRKGQQLDEIKKGSGQLEDLKKQRKETAKHITLKELPPEQKVSELLPQAKAFVDTIKLIAYRAETSLVKVVREKLTREDDARSYIRSVMQSKVNLRPEAENKVLHVEIHGTATASQDSVLRHLCEELNATETVYPCTEMRLNFIPLRSIVFQGGQES
jgi:hypothetical protein